MFNLNESKIIQLMEELIKRNGSDLHLTEETIPYLILDLLICSYLSKKKQLHSVSRGFLLI